MIMKSFKQSFKLAAKILSFLILLQSCTVYHTYTSSVDEAVKTNDKVKLDVVNDDPYKFKNLTIIEDEYYGLAKIKSETYNRLSDRKKLESNDEKFSYVRLNEEELKEIHLKNIKASKTLSIVVPVVVGLGVLVGVGVIVANEAGSSLDGMTYTMTDNKSP